jgi:hypothetical protein
MVVECQAERWLGAGGEGWGGEQGGGMRHVRGSLSNVSFTDRLPDLH